MRTTVTPIQQAAISYYADPSRDRRTPAVATERALLTKGLIRQRQATDAEKTAIGRPVDQPWRVTELTPAGRLLLPDVDVTDHQPSVTLTAPALFPTTDEDF